MGKSKIHLDKDIKHNIKLVVQPFYDINEGTYSNGEILIRGKISNTASEVLNEVERRNKQAELDLHILNKICRKLSKLDGNHKNTGEHLSKVITEEVEYKIYFSGKETLKHFSRLNINLSPTTLNTPKAGERIISIIEDNSAEDKIVLEISENCFVESEICKCNIEKLLNSNVKISLDDINFSSRWMDLLTKYKIYELKYKLSKPLESYDGTKGSAIGSMELNMLRHLKMFCDDIGVRLIVECVEDVQQLIELNSIGVRLIQGYLICKPIGFIE